MYENSDKPNAPRYQKLPTQAIHNSCLREESGLPRGLAR
jgi:hypothetical protein